MNKNNENVEYYSKLVNQFGNDVKSLNWGSNASQELRFQILSEIGDISNKSILDIGCGLGDLYKFLNKKEKVVKYSGIDITPSMIEMARKNYSTVDFSVKDYMKDEIGISDYIFISGIFTYQSKEFFEKSILSLFQKVRLGISFNLLSSWADTLAENEFYADPIETVKFCKSITRKFAFRHDYHPADFTIYLYK
ncbi:class I SAM-dependent methyltransferase [Leptospira sp. GIMC2001]|uniref:class I SAM-dependent methyltransferase n=1 Tax=Leptospira sp. GIMC2001 TaxID=1513297 RepID=UPI00234AD8C8|nr:class I SAM-dependent methyltransferase [Leptospira sp. GIMC2001]WCL51231.1 methyltransferase domain-containing protein [Leptospira sp. GIMC2001]